MSALGTMPKIGYREKDAAAFVGVSCSTFRAWVEQGIMPQARKIGGCKIYRADDLHDAKLAYDEAKSGRDRDSFPTVYFIQGEAAGLIKIGRSVKFSARLKTLQASSPDRLTALAVIPGARWEEEMLHIRFKEYREHGEWFRPAQEILDYIAEATK